MGQSRKKYSQNITKDKKKKFKIRAEQLVSKCLKSPQHVRDTILNYMYLLYHTEYGARNRKIQNTIDGNLIAIFKDDYPEEFKLSLIKFEKIYGKS